jgi:hypothetical protein
MRSIEFNDGRHQGSVIERWYPLGYARSFEPLPWSQEFCFELTGDQVIVVDPPSDQRRSLYRGVWPWRFEEREMERILRPCRNGL